MKKQEEEIIKRLDEIVFHDIPVEKLSFKTENSTEFIIDFALYEESKKDYEYWSIKFEEIEELKSDNLQLNPKSDLEILSLNYKFQDSFTCKIQFLLGFGQGLYEVELKCNKIVLTKI